jgi:hypothetical protein
MSDKQYEDEHDPQIAEDALVDSLPEGWERPEKTAPERSYREAFAGTDEEFDEMMAGQATVPEEDVVTMPDTLDSMTNDELRERLASADLPTSGNKQELVDRLREYNQPGNNPDV